MERGSRGDGTERTRNSDVVRRDCGRDPAYGDSSRRTVPERTRCSVPAASMTRRLPSARMPAAIPLALLIATSAWTRLALIGVVLATLIVELLNTAIEKLADRVTLEQDPLIGRVKDMGSAAVGLTLVIAGLVWLLVIWERVSELMG